MYICQEYQELESLNASFAINNLEPLKTLIQTKGQGIKNTALKIVGVKGQQSIPSVNTAVSRSKAISHGLRSSVIWSVGTKAIVTVEERTQVLGKAIRQVIQQSINTLQQPTESLASVSSVVKQKAILTGQTRLVSIREMYQTGLNYVADAIFTMMDLIKHSDDISKFTNNNELPDNWEELTPAIQGNITE